MSTNSGNDSLKEDTSFTKLFKSILEKSGIGGGIAVFLVTAGSIIDLILEGLSTGNYELNETHMIIIIGISFGISALTIFVRKVFEELRKWREKSAEIIKKQLLLEHYVDVMLTDFGIFEKLTSLLEVDFEKSEIGKQLKVKDQAIFNEIVEKIKDLDNSLHKAKGKL